MPAVTFTIEPDELLGLNALVVLDKTADGGSGNDGSGNDACGNDACGTDADAVAAARTLMHTALSGKLTEAGLP